MDSKRDRVKDELKRPTSLVPNVYVKTISLYQELIGYGEPPTPAEHIQYLANVAKNYDDDSYKLVYADYLEEKGFSQRAEFIRVQCELFNWQSSNPKPRNYDSPFIDCRNIKPSYKAGGETECMCPRTDENKITVCEYHKLKEYERELLKDYGHLIGSAVLAIMPTTDQVSSAYGGNNYTAMYEQHNSFKLDRGFVTKVRCSSVDWIKNGVGIVKAHPIYILEAEGENPRKSFTRDEWLASSNLSTDYREVMTILRYGQSPYSSALLFWAKWKAGYIRMCEECDGRGTGCSECKNLGLVSL